MAFDASGGIQMLRLTLSIIQADGKNLNNRINLINFAGLFSSTGWLLHEVMGLD